MTKQQLPELDQLDALDLDKIVVEAVPGLPRDVRELELHQAALLLNLEAATLARLVPVRRVAKSRWMVRVDDLRKLIANPPAEVAGALRAGAAFNAALDAVLPADHPRVVHGVPPLMAIGEAIRARVPSWPELHERRAAGLLRLAGFRTASFVAVDPFPETTRRALRRLRDLLAITAPAERSESVAVPSSEIER